MGDRTIIENLQDLIKDSIGGKVVDQTAELLLPPGENYGSIMYKVDFKVKKDDEEEEHHAVAKCAPTDALIKEVFNIQQTFKSEIAWYTTVIPTLKQFQRDHGVEKEIDFFQPFFGARLSLDPTSDQVDSDGVMLTQNLKYLGYHNVDRHVGFDLPTTYTVLKKLATFHAVPLAIKIQNPELFDKSIKPYLPKFGDFPDDLLQRSNNQIYTIFEQIPECLPIMDRIKKYVETAKLFGGRPVREPWATVIHMDLWTNNIMITGGKDPKIIILDLQFPALGSPAADLMLFLLTSVKLDVVQTKFDEFIKFYFEQFSNNLRALKVSTEDYTFEGLLKEIETEAREGAFAHSLKHSVMILKEKEKAASNSADENVKKEEVDVKVKYRRQIEKFRWIAAEATKRNWI